MNPDFCAKFVLIVFSISFVVFFFIFRYVNLGSIFDYKNARKFHPIMALLVMGFCSVILAALSSIVGLVGYGILM